MSQEEKKLRQDQERKQNEMERKIRERNERLELLRTTHGSDQWAHVIARQVMEVAIRGGTDPATAEQRAAEVEAGLIAGQALARSKAAARN